MAFNGLLGVLLEVMRILETILGDARNKYVGANRHTQVVGFSEQIEKRGQLATIKASFSLEAVSVATCQHGVPPAWYMIARRGLGRRGQVLNWIGAKRYEALRRKGRWRKPGKAVKRRQDCNGICCTAPHV
jgi:hypothetical protein